MNSTFFDKDEIELVRKKLGWMYKPFEIPKNILNEWIKIGSKGSKIENKWNKTYNLSLIHI